MHINAQHLRADLKNKNEKGKTHSHQSFKQSKVEKANLIVACHTKLVKEKETMLLTE